MARRPDPLVEELDKKIISLREKGLTYKDISDRLNIPVSRCRLASRREHYREYLRKYLKKYRTTHPEFYERLKRAVTERCRVRLRTDPEFRFKRNKYAKDYRNSIFGEKEMKNSKELLQAFENPEEVLSTQTLVKRLGKPTYHHFYSRLKTAIKEGLIERVSWGSYRVKQK
jgi:hypothetical protein